jgi:hypothetical protein
MQISPVCLTARLLRVSGCKPSSLCWGSARPPTRVWRILWSYERLCPSFWYSVNLQQTEQFCCTVQTVMSKTDKNTFNLHISGRLGTLWNSRHQVGQPALRMEHNECSINSVHSIETQVVRHAVRFRQKSSSLYNNNNNNNIYLTAIGFSPGGSGFWHVYKELEFMRLNYIFRATWEACSVSLETWEPSQHLL